MKRMFSLLFLAAFTSLCAFGSTDFEVTVFDCGQGNAVAARFGGKSMIFDAGSKARSKFVHYQDELEYESDTKKEFPLFNSAKQLWLSLSSPPTELRPSSPDETKRDKDLFVKDLAKYVFGRKGKRRELVGVFISHPDVDHYNIVTRLVKERRRLFSSSELAFLMGGMKQTYVSLLHEIRKIPLEKRPIIHCDHDMDKDDFEDLVPAFCASGDEDSPAIEILTVNSGKGRERNANSMVVKLSQTHSFLISGDAEGKTWNSIEDEEKKSDVFLLSHHGSYTNDSITAELITAINPKICLISAGFQHGHPDKRTISILKSYYETNNHRTAPHLLTYCDGKGLQCVITNYPIFTTIDNGCLSLNLGATPVNVKTARNFWPDPEGEDIDATGSLGEEDSGGYLDYFSTEDVRKDLFEDDIIKKDRNIYKMEEDLFYRYNGLYFKLESKAY